jgi:hypothetical protein
MERTGNERGARWRESERSEECKGERKREE